MSSNKTGFSHITLEVAKEDEMVFKVNEEGVFPVCETPEHLSENSAGKNSTKLPQNITEVDRDKVSSSGNTVSTLGNASLGNASQKNEKTNSAVWSVVSQSKKTSTDNEPLSYEDLEGEVPFDKLRIVILIVLILILVGGVGYYLAFM